MHIIRIVASTFVFRWFVFCKKENNESLMNLDLLLLKMCNIIQCNGKYRQSYFCCHIINKLNVLLRNSNKCLTYMIKMIYLSNFYHKVFIRVFMNQITIIEFLFYLFVYATCLFSRYKYGVYFIKHSARLRGKSQLDIIILK